MSTSKIISGVQGFNRFLYHFTDTRNLPSIKEHGILSFEKATTLKISNIVSGGNDWSHDADVYSGLQKFVHLCFWDQHPMEYAARKGGRLQETTFLKINPEVLSIPGVMFTNDVSNKSGVTLLTPEQAFNLFDRDVLFKRSDWKDPLIRGRIQKTKKYEVLIPDCVPLDYIRF